MSAQTAITDTKKQEDPVSPKAKEQEPAVEKKGEDLAGLIQEVETHDKEAAEKVSGEIKEARQSVPEIGIPPDVADAGVKSPAQEAADVIAKGSTLDVPITEEKYKEGLHQKVTGKVVNKVVVGVSGLFALAAWVGRMVKIAHKHTMRVVFRKPSFAKASEGKEEIKDAD